MNEENTISLKVSADNLYVSKDRKEIYLFIDLKAKKATLQKERTPLNLSLVLDRSGSMSGDKIKYARQACKFVVENLEPDDNLSVVIYDDQVEILSASAPVKDKNALKRLIDGVTDRGSTNLSGGMLEGYNQTKKTYNTKHINRVLLLSDGLANAGITDEKVLQQIARQKNTEEHTTLSAFGIGADFNEVLMTNLAEYGSGNYYFIDSPDKIPSIFAKELQGLLSVVAQNASLKVKFPSKTLAVSKIFGYPGQVKNDEIVFDIKDVFSEEQKSVLIKFSVKEPFAEESAFETTLTYDDASTFKRILTTEKTHLKVTADKNLFDNSFNKEVLQQIILFENNERLETAMGEVDHGNYDKAKTLIIEIKTEMTVQMKRLPNNAEILVRMGGVTRRLGRWDEALALHTRAAQ
ncbi:MAG: VWA domain-containing protein, partial [Verrucomicrobia bacterium]|nr:VWA domain-containing protein [Cytophagales bacterium]